MSDKFAGIQLLNKLVVPSPVPKSGLLQFPISQERFLKKYIDKTPNEKKI